MNDRKPRYIHHCDCCISLCSYYHINIWYDLWYHRTSNRLYIRYGNHPTQYYWRHYLECKHAETDYPSYVAWNRARKYLYKH